MTCPILSHLNHDQVIDLIPNGSKIPVTNSNKMRYLDALAQYRLVQPVKEEVDSFMRGLSSELIPENLLSIFDEYELEVRRVSWVWSYRESTQHL